MRLIVTTKNDNYWWYDNIEDGYWVDKDPVCCDMHISYPGVTERVRVEDEFAESDIGIVEYDEVTVGDKSWCFVKTDCGLTLSKYSDPMNRQRASYILSNVTPFDPKDDAIFLEDDHGNFVGFDLTNMPLRPLSKRTFYVVTNVQDFKFNSEGIDVVVERVNRNEYDNPEVKLVCFDSNSFNDPCISYFTVTTDGSWRKTANGEPNQVTIPQLKHFFSKYFISDYQWVNVLSRDLINFEGE